jgi:hypothetical protein
MLGDVVGVDGVINEPLTDKSNLSRQTCLKLYNASRHTDIITTTVSGFTKYVLKQQVFDHQDWSNHFHCWVSRPGYAARARTLFCKRMYVKSDSAPIF